MCHVFDKINKLYSILIFSQGGKKLKRKLLAVVLSLALILSLGSVSFAAEKKFEWTFVSSMGPSLVQNVYYRQLCQEITKRSNGALHVEFLMLGEHPYSSGEMLSVIRDGLAQMGQGQGLYVTGEEPLMGAVDLAFMMPNLEKAIKIKNRWISEVLQDYLGKKWNQRITTSFLLSGEAVHAHKILNSFEDLKGQKIRVWSKETSELVEVVGAVPVTVAYSEVYPALQKGIVDGGLTTCAGAYTDRWWEVVDHITIWNFSFPLDFSVVNLEAFNGLPEDLQKIVLDTCSEYEKKLQAAMDQEVYTNIVKGIEKYNTTVTGISPEFYEEIRKRAKPAIWDPWVKRSAEGFGEKFLKIVNEELK